MAFTLKQDLFYRLFPLRHIARNFRSESTDIGNRDFLPSKAEENPALGEIYELTSSSPFPEYPSIPDYQSLRPDFFPNGVSIPESAPHLFQQGWEQFQPLMQESAEDFNDKLEIERAVAEAAQPANMEGMYQPEIADSPVADFALPQETQPMESMQPAELHHPVESQQEMAVQEAPGMDFQQPDSAMMDDDMQMRVAGDFYDPMQMGGLEQRILDPYMNPLYNPLYQPYMPFGPIYDPFMMPGLGM